MATDVEMRDMDPNVGGGVDRDKLASSDFVYPEDRSFPVVTSADVMDAVHSFGRGKHKDFDEFKQRLTALCKRKGSAFVDALPKEWTSANSDDEEDYAVVQTGDLQRTHFARPGNMVEREGKIFEAGVFKDKKFSMSDDELDQAVASFTPVEIDLEHINTILSGKMGKLVAVWRKGQELMGRIQIPAWLDKQIGTGAVKCSCTWDRETKQLVGLALTIDPRIPDAKLVAAYSAATTTGGAMNPETHTLLSKVLGLLANIHKTQGKQQTESDGTTTSTMTDNEDEDGEEDMAKSPAGDTQDDGDTTESDNDEDDKPKKRARPKKEDAAMSSVDPKIAGLEAEVTTLKAERQQERAEHWADTQITAGRAYPAERDALVAQYNQNANDDAVNPTKVMFTGKEFSRLELFTSGIETRPAHGLTGEMVAAMTARQRGTKNAPVLDDDKRKEYLEMTPLGREVLRATQQR